MSVEIHVWKLSGITPLLQSNPACMGNGSGPKIQAGKPVYDDDKEAAMRVYKGTSGVLYHPSTAIRSALIVAGTGRKIMKRAAKSIISAGLMPAEPEMVLLQAKTGKPFKKWDKFKCRVVVSGSGVLRVFPRFDDWRIDLPMEVDRDFFPDDAGLEMVTELLKLAGRLCGIGQFRPDTSKGKTGTGTYGRFTAELIK